MMKRYPYFMTDGVFVLAVLALLLFAIFSGTILNYILALVGIAFIAWRYVSEGRKARDFSESVSCIKGLRSWEAVFLSFGTLKFGYKGEDVFYSSEMGQRLDGTVQVGYGLGIANRANGWFDARQKKDGPGFDLSGDRKLFALVKGDIEKFDRKYEVVRIRQSDGLLQTEVRLEFSTKPLAKEEKAAEMCEFLEEYLEFGLALNKKLKTAGPKR
jgi:hypothetical protein